MKLTLGFDPVFDTRCPTPKRYWSMESKAKKTKKKAAKKQPKAPKYTFKQFLAEYPDDDACLHQIFIRTHGENTPCTECEAETT